MALGPFGKWGDVPADPDVRPFSAVNPIRSEVGRANRKHHFISVVYMRGFVGECGRLHVYMSDNPERPQPMRPKAVGYENHYYSQPLPGGGIESHRFEDLWNSVETVWPETVQALRGQRVSQAVSFNVLGMMAVMRARVPAARDRHALLLEAKLRSEVRALERIGALPADLQRYKGELDTVPIGIDPQQTLMAMREELFAFGQLCFRLGFELIYNQTEMPFLTSDNPVCSYNPRASALSRAPYDHSGEVELVFPLTATMLVRGSSRIRPTNEISRHRDLIDVRAVRRINRTIAQFAYRMTLSRDRSCDELVRTNSALAPTIATSVRQHARGTEIIWRHIFGPRPVLSQFIDTPEKAARLEARIAANQATSVQS